MRRVLIVEDDAEARRMLTFALRENGYEVAEAATGFLAQEEVARRDPDVILLDLYLSAGMNGGEFLALASFALGTIATIAFVWGSFLLLAAAFVAVTAGIQMGLACHGTLLASSGVGPRLRWEHGGSPDPVRLPEQRTSTHAQRTHEPCDAPRRRVGILSGGLHRRAHVGADRGRDTRRVASTRFRGFGQGLAI